LRSAGWAQPVDVLVSQGQNMMDAYAALGQHRSTQRKVPRGGEDEKRLSAMSQGNRKKRLLRKDNKHGQAGPAVDVLQRDRVI
jgi:hypothetical protein